MLIYALMCVHLVVRGPSAAAAQHIAALSETPGVQERKCTSTGTIDGTVDKSG